MKIKPTRIEIESLDKEDLVRLIAVGLTDSPQFGIRYDKRVYKTLPDTNSEDCIEDKCAKVLLAGGSCFVTDYDADGCDYDGADLTHTVNEDDTVEYRIDLDAIRDGLHHAANAEFIPSCKDELETITKEQEYVRTAFDEFADKDSGGFDEDYASTLWQIILFNEVIYC